MYLSRKLIQQNELDPNISTAESISPSSRSTAALQCSSWGCVLHLDDNTLSVHHNSPSDKQEHPEREQVLGSTWSTQAMTPFSSVAALTCALITQGMTNWDAYWWGKVSVFVSYLLLSQHMSQKGLMRISFDNSHSKTGRGKSQILLWDLGSGRVGRMPMEISKQSRLFTLTTYIFTIVHDIQNVLSMSILLSNKDINYL